MKRCPFPCLFCYVCSGVVCIHLQTHKSHKLCLHPFLSLSHLLPSVFQLRQSSLVYLYLPLSLHILHCYRIVCGLHDDCSLTSVVLYCLIVTWKCEECDDNWILIEWFDWSWWLTLSAHFYVCTIHSIRKTFRMLWDVLHCILCNGECLKIWCWQDFLFYKISFG